MADKNRWYCWKSRQLYKGKITMNFKDKPKCLFWNRQCMHASEHIQDIANHLTKNMLQLNPTCQLCMYTNLRWKLFPGHHMLFQGRSTIFHWQYLHAFPVMDGTYRQGVVCWDLVSHCCELICCYWSDRVTEILHLEAEIIIKRGLSSKKQVAACLRVRNIIHARPQFFSTR